MASPGCVLRVSGVNLDPDDVLRRTSLQAVSVWNNGDKRADRVCAGSGFVLNISNRALLDQQIEDSIQFINARRLALQSLRNAPAIDDIRLDFGIALREAAVQSNTFPSLLVRLAGEFDIALELSQYPPDDILSP